MNFPLTEVKNQKIFSLSLSCSSKPRVTSKFRRPVYPIAIRARLQLDRSPSVELLAGCLARKKIWIGFALCENSKIGSPVNNYRTELGRSDRKNRLSAPNLIVSFSEFSESSREHNIMTLEM